MFLNIKIRRIGLLSLIVGVMVFNLGSEWAQDSIIWYGCLGIAVLISAVSILVDGFGAAGPVLCFPIGFAIICFASILWATSQAMASAGARVALLSLVVIIAFSCLIHEREDIWFLLKLLVLSGVILILYLSARNGVHALLTLREDVDSSVINANEFGVKCTISSFCAYVLVRFGSKCRKLYTLAALVFIVFALSTASRKVLVLIAFLFGLSYIISSERGKMRSVVIVLLIAVLAVFAVYQVPYLYDLIGARIDEMLSAFGAPSIDLHTSTGQRLSYIELGMSLFNKKPFFGHGIANAAYYNGTYLHNNYVELLADVGLIGTLVYYAPYFVAIYSNGKCYREDHDPLALTCMLLVLGLIVIDVFQVSYLNRTLMLIPFLGCSYGLMATRNSVNDE